MELGKIGIVGTGVMGTGIARLAALRDFHVVIVGREASLYGARKRFDDAVIKDRERQKLSVEQHIALKTGIDWSHDAAALADCNLVIESIVEDFAAKEDCYGRLKDILKAEAVLATNTSSIDVHDLAQASHRPERFLGLHFFNPVEVMTLVEFAAPMASLATCEAGKVFVTALGHLPIDAPTTPGYRVNRLMLVQQLEAIRMCAFLSDVQNTDVSVREGLKHPMGPFELMDFVGLDVIYAIAEHLYHGGLGPAFTPPRLLERMIEEGDKGRKTGKGFYDYADRKHPKLNESVGALLAQTR